MNNHQNAIIALPCLGLSCNGTAKLQGARSPKMCLSSPEPLVKKPTAPLNHAI
jgi:hypothetical protein